MSDPINKLFKPPVDPRSHREQRIPRAVQNSADFWVDTFTTTLSDLIGVGDDYLGTDAQSIVHHARLIADAALVEFEDRWPGIKL